MNPNLSQIEHYRDAGLWDEGLGVGEIAIVGFAGLFTAGTDMLILVASIMAVVMLARRRLTAFHLVALLMFAYVFALVALLQYQPRHMNTAWPAMIMFTYPIATTISATLAGLGRSKIT